MLILNTGGTFNKIYNSLRGELEVSQDENILTQILTHFPNLEHELKGLFHIDSLEMDDTHREKLCEYISNSSQKKILIIHGTDTLDKTAVFVEKKIQDKVIVLTGAMVPWSIDPVEASCNLASAIGFLNSNEKEGVFIAMHGIIDHHGLVYKNKEKGIFEYI